MKALFVLHDQMWDGAEKNWAGLGSHTITSYDLGWVTQTLPPASVITIKYQSNSDENAKVSSISTICHQPKPLSFLLSFLYFQSFREMFKIYNIFQYFLHISNFSFTNFFFFFFYPLVNLKAKQTICPKGFNYRFIDFPHIGPLSLGFLVVYKHTNLYLSVYRHRLCKQILES